MLTLNEKRDRLRKLPAEVPELHDWLQVLFTKLPNVAYVEYTHGTNELGADFVLEITNATTGRNEYVGVIAKKGTIKQDTADVERQIKECGVPRIIKNGKDEQALPIIWVISNEVVTANAEKKIRNNYAQYAIQFFSADDLIRWTDSYALHLWDDLPSKISQYLQSTRAHLQELEKNADLLGEQSYGVKLELDLSPVDPESYRKRKQRRAYVSLLEEIQLRKLVFVEGEMGAGKSQILRSLGIDLCRSETYNNHRILPVFATYRAVEEKFDGSLATLLQQKLGDLISELDNGRATAVLLIDGLDELASTDSEDSPLSRLATEARELDRVTTVFSCRSGVVPQAILRGTPALRHLEVRPLSLNKMTTFIKTICEKAKLKNRIVRDIGKSDLFKQLPQNPIAALLLTRLMLQSKSRDELPQTLTDLYSKSLELMLGRWDLEKRLGSQQEHDVARRICGQLAKFMIENRLLSIGVNDIRSRLREYLRERNLSIDDESLLDRLFSRSGVLVLDPSNATATFKHKSFAEYFCAEEWLRVNSSFVDSRALDVNWTTVYFFAIGLRSDCEEVLKEVLSLAPNNENERLGKIFAAPSYLLAGHMTPYRIVEENLPKLLLQAAKLYVDISSHRVESQLIRLPSIQLLYIFQFLIREKYGYRFFRKAIDDAAIAIGDAVEEDAVKAHALFFLGVIGIDLEYPDALRFLAETFDADQLPIGLSIAVRSEAERAQPRGMPPVIRAFNKRVHKMLKTNRSLRDSLEELFKRPIGLLEEPKIAAKKGSQFGLRR